MNRYRTFALSALIFMWLGRLPLQGYTYAEVRIKDLRLNAEVTETNFEKWQGLGGRTDIPSDYAMLFLFEANDPQEHTFWMKGMLVPIDIIWILGDQIVHIEAKVPPPRNMLAVDLPTYGHGIIADKVLEIQAGLSAEHGLKAGDRVSIKY